MDFSWGRHRSLQLSPTKCLRSAASGGRNANVAGRLRQVSGQKKPGAKGRGQKSLAKDFRSSTCHFLGDSAKFSTSPVKSPALRRVEIGNVTAAQRSFLGGQERGASIITRARKQPMPQGTFIKNQQFRKPKTTPSNSEYLEDEGWGTEVVLEDVLVEDEEECAVVSGDDTDDGEETEGPAQIRPRRLERQLSVDSLDTEEIGFSDPNSGAELEEPILVEPERPRRSYTELQSEGSGEQQRDGAPERPRRVYREITPLGEFKEDAEEKQRQKMKAMGHVRGTAFGIKTPVTDGPIGRKLGLVDEPEDARLGGEQLEDGEEEEYQGKRVVLERIPGARRKANVEDALPPKAQTKEEFDRLYEEYLQREEEKREEAKRQKALFEAERQERVRLIDIEREKRKAELARVGIVEDKKFDIPSETIERIQRLKGKEKREAWVAAWKRVRRQENKEKHKVRQSKAALQKEAEDYLHLAMQKLIGGDITRVRGRTAMDIIANTMAGRLGDALPANQNILLEDIPPLPANYRTVEEKTHRIYTSTYIEQFRPEGESGQAMKSVVNPFRETDPKLAQEKRLPSVNLESAALFGRGSDLDVESDIQASIAADLARLEREVQLELGGGAGSSVSEGEEANESVGVERLGSTDTGVANEASLERGLGSGVRGSDPQGGADTDSDTDDRRDASGTAGSTGQAASADDSDSDDDDIKKIGEDLFPDYDGTVGGPTTAAFADDETSSNLNGFGEAGSVGDSDSGSTTETEYDWASAEDRDPDDIRTIGEGLFRAYDPNVSINDMGKVLSRSIAQHSGYRKLTVPHLADSMPEAKTLNQFLQTLSFKTHEIEARIRKASADQAIRVSRRRHAEKAEADQQWRRQLMARGGGDFWEAAGKYPAGPKGETFAKVYDKARSKVPVGAVAVQSAGAETVVAGATRLASKLAPMEDFQVPPGRTVIRVGANECLECEGVNKDGSKCVRLVTVKDIAKYGGRIMCWQHR